MRKIPNFPLLRLRLLIIDRVEWVLETVHLGTGDAATKYIRKYNRLLQKLKDKEEGWK